MTDELKLNHDKDRGARAEAFLRSDLFNEAFTALEAQYIDAWRKTHINDTQSRERLHQAVQLLGKVKDHLITVANNGKLAMRELADLAEKERRTAQQKRAANLV